MRSLYRSRSAFAKTFFVYVTLHSYCPDVPVRLHLPVPSGTDGMAQAQAGWEPAVVRREQGNPRRVELAGRIGLQETAGLRGRKMI